MPRYRFGDFLLEPDEPQLWLDESRLDVPPKVIALLGVLCRRAGRLVTYDHLYDSLWPGVFVSQDSVFKVVSETRRVLANAPSAAAPIETVYGKGYRFAAPVTVEDPVAMAPSRDGLVGRVRTLAELDEAMSEARLVTLKGTGGVGKTRLAREHIRRRTGALWVDLAEARTEGDLLRATATVLGLTPRGPDAAQQIGHALAGRDASVLVLDNLEQLVPNVGPLETWLDCADDLHILATSRVPLAWKRSGCSTYPPCPRPRRSSCWSPEVRPAGRISPGTRRSSPGAAARLSAARAGARGFPVRGDGAG